MGLPLAVGIAEPCLHGAVTAETPPNILFIYTDDQSHRTVGCYRNEGAPAWVRTPNIDRLATEGVRFSDAYGAAWCSPSRACVLTGLLPHGINDVRLKRITFSGDAYDPAVARFWPVQLRKSGYHTAMIGKWHLGQNPGHGCLWDHSVVWDQNKTQGDWYNDQALATDGAASQIVPGYVTDVFTHLAADYVRRSHDRPWFLWLCYNAPHLPNSTHPRHQNTYTDAEVSLPTDIFGPRPDKPGYMRDFSMFQRAPDGSTQYETASLPEMIRGYNRLVSAVDEGVGQLLRVLEETRQLENTLVIFTSDQGFAWGEHGFAMKLGPYDANLRMPLIFRMPGRVARGEVCRQPVSVVDIPPTLLGFAGVPLPWEMHGHDLAPLLRRPHTPSDRPMVMENFGLRLGTETDRGETGDGALMNGRVPWWLFLRQGKYKYIRTLVPDEIEELYDLESDPHELKNLALDASHRPTLVDYENRLRTELKRTKAALVDKLPPPRR